MRILIDGYNLIRRVPELKEADRTDLQQGRNALLEHLATYGAGKGHRITVVFDGADAVHLGGNRERIGGILVRYSPRGVSADSDILTAISKNETDVLVSADRVLTDAASQGGVTPVSPELFWDRVQEEIYRQFKGEEEEQRGVRSAKGGRKLSKSQRRDSMRRGKL